MKFGAELKEIIPDNENVRYVYYNTSGQTRPKGGSLCVYARRMPAGRTQAVSAIATQAPASNALADHACSGKGQSRLTW